VPVSADCAHQNSEGYGVRGMEGQVMPKSDSYSSAVESLRQSESAVLTANDRSNEDTGNDISSLPSTYTGCHLSLS